MGGGGVVPVEVLVDGEGDGREGDGFAEEPVYALLWGGKGGGGELVFWLLSGCGGGGGEGWEGGRLGKGKDRREKPHQR